MPPTEQTKIEVRIFKRFTHGRKLYAPGIWEVDQATANSLVKAGKASLVKAPAKAETKPTTPTKAPDKNPRVPEPKAPEVSTEPTPLPEDFPSREILAEAGFDSVESLKAPGVKEALESIEGLTPAEVTKIGFAISKL